MRDYYMVYEGGQAVPVALMPTDHIHGIIEGRHTVTLSGTNSYAELIDRLRLELFIREHNLRAGL